MMMRLSNLILLLHQLNIITAFLESLMKETVYVEQPHGFEEPKGARYARVCHPLRALHGLKQAPREWYLTLISYLMNLGYKRLEHDHCVLVTKTASLMLFLWTTFSCLVFTLQKSET